ncbi:MAG: hypothetical protein JSR15_04760 [Proteobacteria bacterium]|nr:hypothetical protein [Pseudomonadota bacterium]
MAVVSDPAQQLRALNPRLNGGVYVFVTLADGQDLDASGVVATINEAEGTSVIIEAGAAAAAAAAARRARRLELQTAAAALLVGGILWLGMGIAPAWPGATLAVSGFAGTIALLLRD